MMLAPARRRQGGQDHLADAVVIGQELLAIARVLHAQPCPATSNEIASGSSSASPSICAARAAIARATG